jgi:predicted outer membrane protein
MKTNQALFALVIAAAAPFAAYAESPDAIKFYDAPSTLSVAQVRADYLASDRAANRFGEAYPTTYAQTQSVKTRQEVRADYLASDRSGQRFGEAYPTPANAKSVNSVAGMQADVK